jgi:hypothetical protein
MSIPVSLEKLRAEVERYGKAPFLLTVSDDARPHSVSVAIGWDGDALVLNPGKRTRANVAARPLVSLLWAPLERGGYSLIVDADASVRGEGEAARVVVRPTRAVLHRPAEPGTVLKDGCSADCVRIVPSGV